ncbi:MAG: hypothetical protein ACJAYU_002435 [Bradymonadia bacterium]|jgi:hypothetical protein
MSLRLASLSLALLLAACGAKQVAEVVAEPDVDDAPCCLDDRWEEPPPQVGQTPPEELAADDALEPFEPDDSQD